jgi:hypothetical protein
VATGEIDVDCVDEYVIGRDFDRRDLISFHHTEFDSFRGTGTPTPIGVVAARVIGWKCTAEAGSMKWTLVLGAAPRNYAGEMWLRLGIAGGRLGGAPWRTRGGW